MVKKVKKAAKSNSKKLSAGVKISAQQIWQAGLDALAVTQQEGGKIISRMAKEGSSLQARSQKIAGDKASDLSDGFFNMTTNFSKQASDSWGKLEHVIEQTVTHSLNSLGLSTQKELQGLHKRIDDLTKSATAKTASKKSVSKKSVAKNSVANKAVAKKAVKKVAAKKTAVKPTVSKKPAAKKAATWTRSKTAK